MKALFIVKHKGKPVKGATFDSKSVAKAIRDNLGGVEQGYTVSLGVDHKRYRHAN